MKHLLYHGDGKPCDCRIADTFDEQPEPQELLCMALDRLSQAEQQTASRATYARHLESQMHRLYLDVYRVLSMHTPPTACRQCVDSAEEGCNTRVLIRSALERLETSDPE